MRNYSFKFKVMLGLLLVTSYCLFLSVKFERSFPIKINFIVVVVLMYVDIAVGYNHFIQD